MVIGLKIPPSKPTEPIISQQIPPLKPREHIVT